MIRSLGGAQEFIVRVGKFEQISNRLAQNSLTSISMNSYRPKGTCRYGLAANKKLNEIPVGRRQTMGQVLAQPAQQLLIRGIQGRDGSQHDRVDEKSCSDRNYQPTQPHADEPSRESGCQSCKQDAAQNLQGQGHLQAPGRVGHQHSAGNRVAAAGCQGRPRCSKAGDQEQGENDVDERHHGVQADNVTLLLQAV